MPKRKPDQVIVHRIELQTKEREALEMVAASTVVRNVGEGVGAVMTPLTRLSIASLGTILGALTVAEVMDPESGLRRGWDKLTGFLWGGTILDKASEAEREERSEKRKARINLFITSVEQKVSGLQPDNL